MVCPLRFHAEDLPRSGSIDSWFDGLADDEKMGSNIACFNASVEEWAHGMPVFELDPCERMGLCRRARVRVVDRRSGDGIWAQ